MLLDFDDIALLAQMAKNRTGSLVFECSTLGLFENFEADLDGPMRAMIMARANNEQRSGPSLFGRLMESVASDYAKPIKAVHSDQQANEYWLTVRSILARARFRRAVADLSDREISVLQASCVHTLAQRERRAHHDEFLRFMIVLNAKVVWCGGRGQFLLDMAAGKYVAEVQAARELAEEMMRRHISADQADYEQDIGNMLGQYVDLSRHSGFAEMHPDSAVAISRVIDPTQTAWATIDHIRNGETPFELFNPGKSLFLGDLVVGGDKYAIGFSGNESLVTVAQPGAGKTQGHVVPNLLTYDGSIVALDPKCELLELTAKQRKAAGKRILVLSLADDRLPTHKFNVMQFVDTRPDFLWGSIYELAEFLLPAVANDHQPIFRTKAVEMFAVCLGGALLEAKDKNEVPTLTNAIAKIFKSVESLKAFLHDTEDRAGEFGCAPLEQSAASLAGLANNDKTTEDFQRYQSNATSVLTKYRGGLIDRVANGPTDWKPEDLRKEGTTLYIRVPFEEMSVYGGFVRMVLATIIKRLRKSPTEQQRRLPVTMLLDEVAQLGNLDQIANVIETGRGYGIRAWMILQDYDQARAASSKPNLLLKTPKVRLFMNPTLETAQDISAELGKINQIITGQDKPLAEPAQLMGRDFAENVTVLSSGTRPLRLLKRFPV